MLRVNPFSGQFGISPRRLDNEFVAFDQKVSGLFGPDPLRVPGGIHTGDPLIATESIRAW